MTLKVGETSKIDVVVMELEKNDKKPISYVSNNKTIATVSTKGTIKGISIGTTMIYLYIAGVPYYVSVTVVK